MASDHVFVCEFKGKSKETALFTWMTAPGQTRKDSKRAGYPASESSHVATTVSQVERATRSIVRSLAVTTLLEFAVTVCLCKSELLKPTISGHTTNSSRVVRARLQGMERVALPT